MQRRPNTQDFCYGHISHKNSKAKKGARKVAATTSKPKQPFTATEQHASLFMFEKEDINTILEKRYLKKIRSIAANVQFTSKQAMNDKEIKGFFGLKAKCTHKK